MALQGFWSRRISHKSESISLSRPSPFSSPTAKVESTLTAGMAELCQYSKLAIVTAGATTGDISPGANLAAPKSFETSRSDASGARESLLEPLLSERGFSGLQIYPSSVSVDYTSTTSVDDSLAAGLFLADNYEEKLSFSSVTPVDVQVRNLSVQVEGTRQWNERFPGLRKDTSDLEARQVKGLLTQIDADFPRGTLTGILGSSGSGKVRGIFF